MEAFTIGYSTRTIEEFAEILKEYGIEQVVDVRTIPKSRYNPKFDENNLPKALRSVGIKYLHLEKLGGLRHVKKDSKNLGWKNSSFRGFADYMQTDEFEEGLRELIKIAGKNKTVIMCAEAVPWRCHRSLIGDALLVRGIKVTDIFSKGSSKEHEVTPFAKINGKNISYP